MKKEPINTIRTEIPDNIPEKLELAKRVNEKHLALGNLSPLNILDWANVGPQIEIAAKYHKDAEELRRQMEEFYKKRDEILYPIDDLLKQSRDLLKSIYRKEPFKIGEFGFNIDSTPAKKSKKSE